MLQDQRWNHIGLPAAHDFTFVRQKLSHGEIDTIVARRWNLSYFWWRVHSKIQIRSLWMNFLKKLHLKTIRDISQDKYGWTVCNTYIVYSHTGNVEGWISERLSTPGGVGSTPVSWKVSMLWASYLSPKCCFQKIQRSWKPTNWVAHKKLLFSIHLLIHSLIDWLFDSLYWSIHWLISDMIYLDTTKMEKHEKNLLQLPWHFCDCWHPMGPAGPWRGLPLPHHLLGATPAFSGASGVPSYPVPCSPALAA